MKISKINNNNNNGFTITELIVVVAGLAALASFSIPNVLSSIKLNRVEEVKALMNSFASDCLGQYRISTDPAEFIEKATPYQLDNEKLSTLKYQIDGDKNKCSHVAIKPLNDKDKDYFAFDFRMSSEGRILKTAIPSDNPRFLNSCKNWAGKNCGLSEAQKAEFERLAALAKAKSLCLSNYNKWLNEGNSGENVSWDNTNETCTRPVFAFEGIPVNSLQAVDNALKAKYGRACGDWRQSKKDTNAVSPGGNSETKSPECGGVKYWFHSGKEFTAKSDWIAEDNKIRMQACIDDRNKARTTKKGQYTYQPSTGPDPCGKTVWLCNGVEHVTATSYQTSSCVPKNNPGGGGSSGGGVPLCRNGQPKNKFVANPRCPNMPSLKNHQICKC